MEKEIERIMQVLQLFDSKINGLQEMTFHTGMFVEFLQIKLAEKLGPDNKPLLELDMQEFGQWAQERFNSMKEEAARLRATNKQPGINLNDE